jgi:hypothetical protein
MMASNSGDVSSSYGDEHAGPGLHPSTALAFHQPVAHGHGPTHTARFGLPRGAVIDGDHDPVTVPPLGLRTPRPAEFRRTWARGTVSAAVLYLLAACLRFWPVEPWSGTLLLHSGKHDPAQMVWFLAWVPWAITHGTNPLFSGYLDYPHGVNLATNTSVPFLAALATPITKALGPIATFNILMRLALAGSAFSMFVVLRRWTTTWVAAFLGGALYGFSSYMLWSSSLHLNLTFLVVPPLILAAVHELVVRQRFHPMVMGTLLALLVVIQWFIDIEVLVDCLLFSLIGVVVLALLHPRLVVEHVRTAWKGFVTAGALAAVLLAYPAWLLVAGPQHLRAPVVPTWYGTAYRVDLFGPVDASLKITTRAPAAEKHLYYLSKLTFHYPEAYIGIPLVVLLVALTLWHRRDTTVRFAAIMVAVAFILSLGPRLSVFGHTTPIPLPGALLVDVPLLDNLEPLRMAGFTFLFAGMLLAICLQRTLDSWGVGGMRPTASGPKPSARHGQHRNRVSRQRLTPRTRPLVQGIVAVGVAATFIPMWTDAPHTVAKPVTNAAEASVVTQHTPRGGVVLFLPYVAIDTDQPMVWQAESDMAYKMVGGYALTPYTSFTSSFFPVPTGALAALVDVDILPAQLGSLHRGRSAQVAACRAVPHVITRYHLDSLVVASKNPEAPVLRALDTALAQPPRHRGTLWMWDHLSEKGSRNKGASCSSLSPARTGVLGARRAEPR